MVTQNNNLAYFLTCRKTFAIYTFIIYIILLSVFIHYDPFSVIKNYYGFFVFIAVFFASFIFAMIVWYDHAITNFSDMNITRTTVSPIWRIFKQSLVILAGFSVSGFFLYWLMYGLIRLTDTHSVISAILYLGITLSLLALVYKMFMNSTVFKNIPIVRFIINIILYIPCILVQTIDYIVNFYVTEKNRTNITEVILLFITIILITLYYVIPLVGNLFILQGGKQLIDDPINIDVEKTLATYMQLNDIPANKPADEITFNYSYGLSCWIYLDSNTSSHYDKYSSILNYGGKPNIEYKASTNTLKITEKMDNDNDSDNDASQEKLSKVIQANSLNTGQQLDESGNLILYTRENMELQKWNNIILNYSNGTLDIFFNGELVKSVMNVVPYMKLDALTVGTTNGAHGGICNLIYFKNTLSSNQIYYIYNSVKNKRPPTLYNIRPTL